MDSCILQPKVQSIQVEGWSTIREIKSELSEPACHRGHGGVCDRMVDSKQETGGEYVRTSEAVQTTTTHAHAQKHSDTCNEVGRRLHQGSVGFSPVKNAL